VLGELSEKIRVIWKSFDLDPSSIDVHAEQLRSVGTKGDLFDLVGSDESEEVRVSNIRGSVGALLDHRHLNVLGSGHVDGHGQSGRRTVRVVLLR